MSKIRRVLVVGGGVGGLTAATVFAQRGVEVVLIERRPAFDVPGIGLGQPANALRIYDALGVLEPILATGFVYDHMCIFDPNRQLIVRHKFLLGDERVPAVCALSRLELHNILLAAAQSAGVEVRLGTMVQEMCDEGERVVAEFSNRRAESFDLITGFDGLRSATRAYLVGTAFVPRASGYGAWRLQVPRPDYLIELIVRPALLDLHVLALDESGLVQALAERQHDMRERLGRRATEKSDDRHRRLLGARRERPHSRPAEQRDEVASVHSITSSAIASTPGGMARPGALAVLRLMISSNLESCTMGRSAGFSPLRMRPV
jgi:2-polyprenyl-6-methoxyphenol hydroxylase-like FAD-dependent oxidoreductase